MDGPRAVLIAGPTASGKSAVALALAERLGGVVINADSMQVYRDLRILTARPDPTEEARAGHRLYGHVDGAEAYSAGRYRAEAAAAIAEAERAGRLPVVVGGTGLYLEALIRGLAEIPPVPEEVRSAVRARANALGAAALHRELARRDPQSAHRLRPSDQQRIVRALEVLEATGRSLSLWQSERSAAPVLDPERVCRVVLSVDRTLLRERIAHRFATMLEKGVLEEVAQLRARRLDPGLPVMKAIGVRPLMRHLGGEVDLETAVGEAVAETRRYAKRQETWFRHRMADWERIEAGAAARELERRWGRS